MRAWPPLLLERAREDDVSALRALEVLCFSHPWSATSFAEEVSYGPPGAVLVLREWLRAEAADRGIRGYCVYRIVADEMHILDVALHPEWRREGRASWLLRFAMRKAARAGARRALLEVRRGNVAAIGLYESLGFRALSVRGEYYSEPVEDALVLARENLGEDS